MMNSIISRKFQEELLNQLLMGSLDGWKNQLARLPHDQQKPALKQLADIVCSRLSNVSDLAEHCRFDRKVDEPLFIQMLFDFLLPIHDNLVHTRRWDEALYFETALYTNFIKQDESLDFYERSFKRLYEPYHLNPVAYPPISESDNDLQAIIKRPWIRKTIDPNAQSGKVLFWFTNYVRLAHMEVCISFFEALSQNNTFYVAALSEAGFSDTGQELERLGLSILRLDEQLPVAKRLLSLVDLCKKHEITEIVFVSVPLYSAFLRLMTQGIKLVWWSMKYPLGALQHFDRLICCRSLIPEIRVFNGTHWLCAPWAYKAINNLGNHRYGSKRDNRFLNLGVLAREEKLISSDLPEILKMTLERFGNTHLFWTGRSRDPGLESRLIGASPSTLGNRTEFCGWVDPEIFLNNIDILIDTPNLAGLGAYQIMSIDKVVLSATDTGSIGVLGSKQTLSAFFCLLDSRESVKLYFENKINKPFYLSESCLIPDCIEHFVDNPELLSTCGKLFGDFFRANLSDARKSANILLSMIQTVDQPA